MSALAEPLATPSPALPVAHEAPAAAALSDVELVSQPELGFDVYPEKPELVDFARSYYLHKAKAATANEQLCVAIITALEFGHSVRSVARVFKIGRNTVDAVVEFMRATGKLEPIKTALANRFLRVSAAAMDEFMDRLARNPGEFSPQELSWAAVNFSKTGSEIMGSGPAVARPKGEGIAAQVEDAFAACLRAANSIEVTAKVETDTQSAGP